MSAKVICENYQMEARDLLLRVILPTRWLLGEKGERKADQLATCQPMHFSTSRAISQSAMFGRLFCFRNPHVTLGRLRHQPVHSVEGLQLFGQEAKLQIPQEEHHEHPQLEVGQTASKAASRPAAKSKERPGL